MNIFNQNNEELLSEEYAASVSLPCGALLADPHTDTQRQTDRQTDRRTYVPAYGSVTRDVEKKLVLGEILPGFTHRSQRFPKFVCGVGLSGVTNPYSEQKKTKERTRARACKNRNLYTQHRANSKMAAPSLVTTPYCSCSCSQSVSQSVHGIGSSDEECCLRNDECPATMKSTNGAKACMHVRMVVCMYVCMSVSLN